ncbi:MAG: hypothetical protein JSW27_00655, partial [Phycisphaerales bacterium]
MSPWVSQDGAARLSCREIRLSEREWRKEAVNSRPRMNIAFPIGTVLLCVAAAGAQRQMEKLGRGVVAINQGGGKVYVGWRMLGTDLDDIAFNL